MPHGGGPGLRVLPAGPAEARHPPRAPSQTRRPTRQPTPCPLVSASRPAASRAPRSTSATRAWPPGPASGEPAAVSVDLAPEFGRWLGVPAA